MNSSRSAVRDGAPTTGNSAASRPLLVISIVLAAAAVALAVFLLGSRGTDESAPPAHFGMAHVHGLGVDPGDGQLLAATHYGLFRVGEDGEAEQVGPTQDFMGFTVVAPDHYLASGHPAADQDAPPNLGLIESTDGGRTWTPVSLSGEADFHSLEARHDHVYGHSGGRLMVSPDMATWEERAPIPLADLAVSPDSADTILATTQQGLAVSGDGGRTFALVDDAPLMVLLSWDDDGTLAGVDPQGVIHVSDDRGRTWQQRGSVEAQPAALTLVGDDLYVATADARILHSRDVGSTFSVRYREP